MHNVYFIQDLLMSGNGGWLNWRYNHVISRNRRLKKGNARSSIDESSDTGETNDTQSIESKIHSLKRLPVTMENLPQIRNLLNATREFRKQMMKRKGNGMRDVDIKENFPYFLTHPETIVVFFCKYIQKMFQTLSSQPSILT